MNIEDSFRETSRKCLFRSHFSFHSRINWKPRETSRKCFRSFIRLSRFVSHKSGSWWWLSSISFTMFSSSIMHIKFLWDLFYPTYIFSLWFLTSLCWFMMRSYVSVRYVKLWTNKWNLDTTYIKILHKQ